MASGMDFVDRAEEIAKARAPKAITKQTFSILSQSARLALWTRDEDSAGGAPEAGQRRTVIIPLPDVTGRRLRSASWRSCTLE